MDKMFLIKRKGFNYYSDYIELYLHRSFEKRGYYLVKEKSKRLFSVIVDVSNDKYMAVLSSYFATLSEEEAKDFAEVLSANFKSEVIVMPCFDKYEFKGTPCLCRFSDTYNAFEEDPYVQDLKPEFVQEIFDNCQSQRPYVVEYINYGGAFKGLEITLAFDSDDVELEETSFNYYKGKERISKEITFEKSGNVFKCSVPDFGMEKGLNKYSAVFRGKKEVNEKRDHSFYVRVIPKSSSPTLVVETTVKPLLLI